MIRPNKVYYGKFDERRVPMSIGHGEVMYMTKHGAFGSCSEEQFEEWMKGSKLRVYRHPDGEARTKLKQFKKKGVAMVRYRDNNLAEQTVPKGEWDAWRNQIA